MELCPWCGREFVKIEDFFYMRILDTEILEPQNVPETITSNFSKDYNYAPEISKLLKENESIKKYMDSLKGARGRNVTRSKILPDMKRDNVFKEFYQIPGNGDFYLSIEERERSEKEEKISPGRIAELSICGKGPNMGGAGCPTLVKIAKIVKINYEGLLDAFSF